MFANLASQKDRDAKPNEGKRKYLPGSERLAEDKNAERHDKNRRQIAPAADSTKPILPEKALRFCFCVSMLQILFSYIPIHKWS